MRELLCPGRTRGPGAGAEVGRVSVSGCVRPPRGVLAGRLLIWSGTPGRPWTETPQNWPPRPAASPRRQGVILPENERVARTAASGVPAPWGADGAVRR